MRGSGVTIDAKNETNVASVHRLDRTSRSSSPGMPVGAGGGVL